MIDKHKAVHDCEEQGNQFRKFAKSNPAEHNLSSQANWKRLPFYFVLLHYIQFQH